MLNRIASLLLLFASITLAAEPAGSLQSIAGKVEVSRPQAPGWKAARLGQKIFMNDELRTDVESTAEIRWTNGGVLRIAERSAIAVSAQPPEQNSTDPGIKMLQGRMWANMQKISRTGKKFSVESPTAVAGIRGTIFRVNVAGDSTTDVLVYEGKVGVGPGALLKQLDSLSNDTTRNEVDGPQEIDGPQEVTLEQWVDIVAGQQIRVAKSGKFTQWEFDQAKDRDDPWVKYNQDLDKALEQKNDKKK